MSTPETINRLEQYQKLYNDLTERMEKLLRFEKEFQDFSDDLYELETYYHKKWLGDHDAIKKEGDDKKEALLDKFSILGEDTIWELLSEHYEYNKRLIKVLADELNN